MSVSNDKPPWAEFIEAIPEEDRDACLELAEKLLPGIVPYVHSRNLADEQDDVAISTAIRCAAKFYLRIDTWKKWKARQAQAERPAIDVPITIEQARQLCKRVNDKSDYNLVNDGVRAMTLLGDIVGVPVFPLARK